MSADWFRRTTWTPEDEREFRARLGRARPQNRAQYLRIQALSLIEAEPPFPDAALALLDEMLRHWPDQLQLSSAHLQVGRIHEARGEFENALGSYASAVEAMRAHPHLGTDAPEAFALLVARLGRRLLFDDALTALEDFPPSLLPVHRFRHFAARALIHEARRETSEAATLAAAALEEAGRDRAPFWKHPTLGLVGPESDDLVAQMKALTERRAPLWERVTNLLSKR